MDDSDARIDALIAQKGTDTDMACVIHAIEPERYIYYGDQAWAVRHPTTPTWIPDKHGLLVWDEVQLWMGQKLLQRALYWKTRADETTDPLERYEFSRNSDVLMGISYQLRKPTYRKSLLEELKIYYVVKQ